MASGPFQHRSPNDSNKTIELNRSMVTASLWNRKAVSRISPDIIIIIIVIYLFI